MKLNHINLTVTDALETAKFLEKYFGLELYEGSNHGMAFTYDDSGAVISLIKAGHGAEVHYPETFHIGFIQESREKVNEINKRLKADGYEVDPPASAHGSWTFYFQAPGGFTIEVLS